MNALVILQARMSSTRLPQKVLRDIVGKPMLQHQIERIQHAKLVDNIVVATSKNKEDEKIVRLCKKLNIPFFQGDLNDVLDRYYHAAKLYHYEQIIRLTGDCPLIDSRIIDDVVSLHMQENADYTSNCRHACLPDGLDVEVFTIQALQKSWAQAKKPSEREHVTQYIRNHSDLFKIVDYKVKENLSHYRWTVDEPEDFNFVTQIYQHLYDKTKNFTFQDILLLLKKHPELNQINNHLIRDQGLIKSLAVDKELGYK